VPTWPGRSARRPLTSPTSGGDTRSSVRSRHLDFDDHAELLKPPRIQVLRTDVERLVIDGHELGVIGERLAVRPCRPDRDDVPREVPKRLRCIRAETVAVGACKRSTSERSSAGCRASVGGLAAQLAADRTGRAVSRAGCDASPGRGLATRKRRGRSARRARPGLLCQPPHHPAPAADPTMPGAMPTTAR
jgi:hypothetical protein